ncbi:sugar transferase [Flavobacteriaceae bacterium]|nr:sugar transferase [Flavobacteriaceae bacterium]
MDYYHIKRLFDFTFAVVGLIIFTPIILLCCLLLILSGEFSPLYLSYRVGRKEKLFKIYKLRTMQQTKQQPSQHFTDHDDERITFLGKILRATKLDELPQFYNILIGDLSFVGPRPQLPEIYDKYDEETKARLKTIKPGVTGLGSLVFRNESQLLEQVEPDDRADFYDNTIVFSKGNLEKWYVKNRGFILDLKILVFTAVILFFTKATRFLDYFIGIPVVILKNKENL